VRVYMYNIMCMRACVCVHTLYRQQV
jgi:hypothetical protein